MRITLSILFCFAYLFGFSQVKNKQMETSASPNMFLMTKNDATLGNVREFVTASEAANTLNANFSFDNIYNIDGTLTGTRSLSLSGYDLTFLQSGIGDVVFYGNNAVWTNYTNSHQAKIGAYNSGTFVGSESSSPFEFRIGNTAQAIIESDGDAYYYNDLGIGISPAYALDVVGEFRLNNATEGIDRVLRSDANGLASWVDLGTLGGGTDDQTLQEVLTSGNDAGGLDALNFAEVEADEFIGDLRGAVLFKAQAGEALSKGDVVYVSGISGNTTIVSKADADDANKMPAFGVVAAAASLNNPVDIYTFGTLSNLNTSAYTLGDVLYVSTTAGQLTATPPTGESALLQNIAKVTRVHASAGSIKISGAGRTNATPNLNTGRLFVGNASNQAVADGTVYVDIANSRVGIGTSSPLERFVVSGGNMQLRGSTYTDFTDYWGSSNNSAFFTPYGFLGSSGSFAVSLYSNGYRNDSAGFTYIGTNGNTSTASGIDLLPTGDIYFRNGTASGTALPIRMTIKNGGNTGIGLSSPSQKLQVAGNIHTDNSGTGRSIRAYNASGKYSEINGTGLFSGENMSIYASGTGTRSMYQGLPSSEWLNIVHYLSTGGVESWRFNNVLEVQITESGLDLTTVPTENTSDILTWGSTGIISKTTKASIIEDAGYWDRTGTYTYLANSTDNVGIGTNSPSAKLHVDEDTNVALDVKGGNIGRDIARFIRDIGTNTTVAINGNGSAAQMYFQNPASAYYSIGNDNSGDFQIANSQYLGTNVRLHIESTSGNVGIGTNSPSKQLTIQSGGNAESLIETTIDALASTTLKNADAQWRMGVEAFDDGLIFRQQDAGYTVGEALKLGADLNVRVYNNLRVDAMTQDDTESQVVVWDSGTNNLRWRDVSTIGDGDGIYDGSGSLSSSTTVTINGYGIDFVGSTDEFGINAFGQTSWTEGSNSSSIFQTGAAFYIQNATSLGSIHLRTGNPSPSTALYVRYDGNIGINTLNPSEKLEVAGNVFTSNNGASNYFRSYHSDGYYVNYKGYGIELSRSVSYIRPTSSGTKDLSIGGSTLQWDEIDLFYDNNVSFHYNGNLLMNLVGDLSLFDSGGTEDIRLNPNGDSYVMNNLGIGTSPSAKLDVVGDTELNGEVTWSLEALAQLYSSATTNEVGGSGETQIDFNFTGIVNGASTIAASTTTDLITVTNTAVYEVSFGCEIVCDGASDEINVYPRINGSRIANYPEITHTGDKKMTYHRSWAQNITATNTVGLYGLIAATGNCDITNPSLQVERKY